MQNTNSDKLSNLNLLIDYLKTNSFEKFFSTLSEIDVTKYPEFDFTKMVSVCFYHMVNNLDIKECFKILQISVKKTKFLENAILNQIEIFYGIHPKERTRILDHYKAIALFESRYTEDAINILLNLIQNYPHITCLYNNLIIFSKYSDKLDEATLSKFTTFYYKHIKDNAELSAMREQLKSFTPELECTDILTIGFVSGDIKDHPVFYFLLNLLEELFVKNCKIFIYVNNPPNPHSELLKKLSHKVIYVENLSDYELATNIKLDNIQILFDLSAHSPGNRLKTFALKPAPVQLSYLGFINSTGLEQIDYKVSAKYFHEKEDTSVYHEQLMLTEHELSFPSNLFTHLQKIEKGTTRKYEDEVILGAYSNSKKLNNLVLSTWAEIMSEAPKTKIIISNYGIRSLVERNNIELIFDKFGVDKSRIQFELPSNKENYIKRFNRTDIALDPFPYTGSTTTHETLLMGVPIITLAGNEVRNRLSADVLRRLNLNEFITYTINDYKKTVIELANSPKRIEHYKNTLAGMYINYSQKSKNKFADELYSRIIEITRK